jgi:hypothetical protein
MNRHEIRFNRVGMLRNFGDESGYNIYDWQTVSPASRSLST